MSRFTNAELIPTFFIKIFVITTFFIKIFVINNMLMKVNTKTLIHY